MKLRASSCIVSAVFTLFTFTDTTHAQVPDIQFALDTEDSTGETPRPPRPGKEFTLVDGLFFLDLTDEQQSSIETILDNSKSDWESLVDEDISAQRVIDDAINADEISEESIRDASKNEAAIKEEMIMFKAAVTSKVRKLLTDDQKATLDKFRELRWDMKESLTFN